MNPVAGAPWAVIATRVYPYPVRAGNQARIASMIEALRAHGVKVALAVAPHRTDTRAQHTATRPRVDTLHALSPSMTRFGRLHRARARRRRTDPHTNARAWSRLPPFDPETACPTPLRQLVDRLARERDAQLVLTEYATTAHVLDAPKARGVFTVIDTHDLLHVRAAQLRDAGLPPDRSVLSRAEEVALLQHADAVLAIQPLEAERLRAMVDPDRVWLVEHALHTDHPLPPPPSPHVATWLASDNKLNRLALAWLTDHVWPQVRAACPTARLDVFGALGDDPRCNAPGIRAAGSVSDPAQSLAHAAVAINPVQQGTGLKIKSVEALAHGRPLVTTTLGAEGLEHAPGLRIADAPHDFAHAILTWLQDPDAAHTTGARGWDYARTRFHPDAVFAPLLQRFPGARP